MEGTPHLFMSGASEKEAAARMSESVKVWSVGREMWSVYTHRSTASPTVSSSPLQSVLVVGKVSIHLPN